MSISAKLKKKLEKRNADLAKRTSGEGFKFFIFKEGKTRMRILNVGDDQEPGIEVTTFWLGKKGTYISPATFGMKCAVNSRYEKYSKSKDEAERELASKFKPKTRFMVLALKSKTDTKWEFDDREGMKPALLTNGQYQDLIDLFLDPENGDFTDSKEGYDIKFQRKGKGQLDTKYSVITCKPSQTPKAFRGPFDIEEEIKKIIPTYEESKEAIREFLANGIEEDDDEKPKKKKKSHKGDM